MHREAGANTPLLAGSGSSPSRSLFPFFAFSISVPIISLNYFFVLVKKHYQAIAHDVAGSFLYQRNAEEYGQCRLLNSTICAAVPSNAEKYTSAYKNSNFDLKVGTTAVNYATLSWFLATVVLVVHHQSFLSYQSRRPEEKAYVALGCTILAAVTFLAINPYVIGPAIVKGVIQQIACEYLPSRIDDNYNSHGEIPGGNPATEPLCANQNMDAPAFVNGTAVDIGAGPLSPFLGDFMENPWANSILLVALVALPLLLAKRREAKSVGNRPSIN